MCSYFANLALFYTFVSMSKWKKIMYIVCGTLAVMCGVVGIFVPGIPTTPFMLLALWFYSHSWFAMHNRLANSRFVKKHINKNGVSLKSKILTILMMITMVSFSTYLYWGNNIISFSLIGLGVTGLFFMCKHIKIDKTKK